METTISLDIKHALQQMGINPIKAMELLAFETAGYVTPGMELPTKTALPESNPLYLASEMER
ncbi:hypothetical protein WMW72_03305 [Paenibacillus filicis]|uniref:Uncharacterized protein n=1 Tax=Paenibacillus filicis TaxID=669464 RepID=A0ABU9DFU3_9BACL